MGVGEWGWGADLPDILKSNKKERKEQKHFIILGKLNPDGGGGDVHAILEFYYYNYFSKVLKIKFGRGQFLLICKF